MSATCLVLVACLAAIPQLMAASSCSSGAPSDREPAAPTSPATASPVDLTLESGQREFRYPDPVTLRVSLRGPKPISEASVHGVVTAPSGNIFTIPFTDHILPGWTLPAGGFYLGALPRIDEDGRYAVTIRADDNEGKARVLRPFTADSRENEALRQQPSTATGSFRVEIEIDIDAVGYAGNPAPPPLRITTLYAEVDSERCVHLFWQAPLNLGDSGSYAIRHAPSRLTSEGAWARASTAAMGTYTAGPGETQTHVSCDLDGGSVYLAVKSTNRDGVASVVSNDYHVVFE